MKRQWIVHSYGKEEELEDPDDFQAQLENVFVMVLFHTTYLPCPTSLHSKNSGMNFIPKEYEAHLNDFHTYGMILASMTFKPFCGV